MLENSCGTSSENCECGRSLKSCSRSAWLQPLDALDSRGEGPRGTLAFGFTAIAFLQAFQPSVALANFELINGSRSDAKLFGSVVDANGAADAQFPHSG